MFEEVYKVYLDLRDLIDLYSKRNPQYKNERGTLKKAFGNSFQQKFALIKEAIMNSLNKIIKNCAEKSNVALKNLKWYESIPDKWCEIINSNKEMISSASFWTLFYN